jgi:peptidoglycan/xylan/chitin deacetylase (PgdA/CDA1 family)
LRKIALLNKKDGNEKMLKVCLVIDVEGFISFKQGNPSWNSAQRFKGIINNIIKDFRYDKNGFEKIYNLIVRERFPASFMLVGSMFKPKKSQKFIDFGYHTLSHKALTLVSDDELHQEIRNIYNATSFSAPMWMIEDAKNPERIFEALKKQGYKIAVYRGINDGINRQHENKINKPVMRYGIKCIYTSNWFHGETRKKIREILREIMQNSEKDAVYCITTHDFSNKNLKNLELLIGKLKEMQENRMIKIVNLKELAI